MKYVQLIHVYHEYSRSLREGDLHGYMSCLPKFRNMFFALNHQNYVSWTVKYHNSLLTLEKTHPETFREYQDGMFGINKTTKPFSGNPIDWHWNKWSMLMQPVRELVLLPWLTQYQHTNLGLNPSFENNSHIISIWRLKSNKKRRYYRKPGSFKHKQR